LKAIILCAGFGTRLRPLTEYWPKPALPLLGHPLFRYSLAVLAKAGVEAVGINTHHLAERMEAVANEECERLGIPLQIVRESTIQGTAGGIRGLRRFVEDDHFIVWNGDVLFPLELQPVIEAHRAGGALATMVLLPMPAGESYATVETDEGSSVKRIAGHGPGGGQLAPWHFSGVHVMSPAVLDFISASGPEDINSDVYPRMLRKALTIQGAVAGGYWSEFGTPARYLEAHLALLEQRVPAALWAAPFSDAVRGAGTYWSRSDAQIRGATVTGPAFFDSQCTVEPGAAVGAGVYVGPRARIQRGSRLRRAVVLERTVISGDEELHDAVAWREHRLFAQPPNS
jgi:mannose-1-phosphate guanylyltransferase